LTIYLSGHANRFELTTRNRLYILNTVTKQTDTLMFDVRTSGLDINMFLISTQKVAIRMTVMAHQVWI